jgi:hypothetical protein
MQVSQPLEDDVEFGCGCALVDRYIVCAIGGNSSAHLTSPRVYDEATVVGNVRPLYSRGEFVVHCDAVYKVVDLSFIAERDVLAERGPSLKRDEFARPKKA